MAATFKLVLGVGPGILGLVTAAGFKLNDWRNGENKNGKTIALKQSKIIKIRHELGSKRGNPSKK